MPQHEVATRQPAARDARAERVVTNRESRVMSGIEPSPEDRGCCMPPPPRQHTTRPPAAPARRATESPATSRSPNERLAFAGSSAHHSVVLLRLGVRVWARRHSAFGVVYPVIGIIPSRDLSTAFSIDRFRRHNFKMKRVCCHFAQVIGITSDPKTTFPFLLKTRAST